MIFAGKADVEQNLKDYNESKVDESEEGK